MSYALAAYAVFVAGFGAWSVIDDLRAHEPLLEIVAEASSLSILIGGMVFAILDSPMPASGTAWLFFVALAVAGELYAVLRSRQRHIRSELLAGTPGSDLRSEVLFADSFTAILLLPAVAINVHHAFA